MSRTSKSFLRLRPVLGAVVFLSVGFGVVSIVPAGCTSRQASPPPAPTSRKPDDTYTVRGKVEMLPSPAKPQAEFMLHHEPIPTFKRPDGKLGMDEMAMPFPVGSVNLDGIAVGDKVEVEFGVWNRSDRPGFEKFELLTIRKLPEDTELRFAPPKGAGKP